MDVESIEKYTPSYHLEFAILSLPKQWVVTLLFFWLIWTFIGSDIIAWCLWSSTWILDSIITSCLHFIFLCVTNIGYTWTTKLIWTSKHTHILEDPNFCSWTTNLSWKHTHINMAHCHQTQDHTMTGRVFFLRSK